MGTQLSSSRPRIVSVSIAIVKKTIMRYELLLCAVLFTAGCLAAPIEKASSDPECDDHSPLEEPFFEAGFKEPEMRMNFGENEIEEYDCEEELTQTPPVQKQETTEAVEDCVDDIFTEPPVHKQETTEEVKDCVDDIITEAPVEKQEIIYTQPEPVVKDCEDDSAFY